MKVIVTTLSASINTNKITKTKPYPNTDIIVEYLVIIV